MKKLLFLLLILSSCSTLRIDQKRVWKISYRNPQLLELYCASMFPVKEKDSVSIQYLPGKVDTLQGDTIVVDCDSAVKWKERKVKVPCPPSYVRTDTFKKIEIKVVETTEALVAEKRKTAELQQKLDRKSFLLRRYNIGIAFLVALLCLFLTLKKLTKWPF